MLFNDTSAQFRPFSVLENMGMSTRRGMKFLREKSNISLILIASRVNISGFALKKSIRF